MMEALGMIRCEDALARLWEFLDGELSPEDERAVKKHLDICDRCYPRYNFQRAYFKYAHRLRDRDHLPPSLRRQIFQRILEQEADNGTGA